MKYVDFEFGKQNLKFWDKNTAILKEFVLKDTGNKIRYFRKAGYGKFDKDPNAKIISRFGFSSFREPFIIEPWNQILIDEANEYGTSVDDNKEQVLFNNKIDETILEQIVKTIDSDKTSLSKQLKEQKDILLETWMSVIKIMKKEWIWVGRSQMVCHPEALIYGEIDEIWFEPKTNTYYIGDTKSSSSVDKIGYWYQLSIYVEILRALNPDKNISSIGVIDWTRIKDFKWKVKESVKEDVKLSLKTIRNFPENKDLEFSELWAKAEEHALSKFNGLIDVKPEDEVYAYKWEKNPLDNKAVVNEIVERDLTNEGILDLVKRDLDLIRKFKIASVDVFNSLLESNEDFKIENQSNQEIYDSIDEIIKEQLKANND